jgi:multidrug efflux pump subunit AcrB
VKFTEWAHSHHRSILFLMVALAIAGLASSLALPVSLFPKVDFPRVVVNVEAGDRPADRMAIEVTWPIEEAVRAVPGVRTVRSTTSRGAADISINFDWGQDMVAATLQTESGINQIREKLPAGTSFEVRRMDPTTVFPVLGYTLTSDTRNLVDLRDIAQYQIRPVLSTVPGVARIQVQGGQEREYQVLVDPAKLDALGLTIRDVADALSAANVVTAVGRLEEHYKLYLVMSNTRLENLEQIGKTVLRSGADGLVSLSDVATIRPGTVPQWTRVTADGRDAVIFNWTSSSRPTVGRVGRRRGRRRR